METGEGKAGKRVGRADRLIGILSLSAAVVLLTLAGMFPMPCAALSLLAAPLLFLGGRLHFACPPAVIALYGALALSLNFDLLTLLTLLTLSAAYICAAALLKRDSLILSGAVSALAAVTAGLILCGVLCAVKDCSPDKLCRDYVTKHAQNGVIVYASEKYFDSLELGDAPQKGTEQYRERALAAYAENLRQNMATDFIYHLTNYCALIALLLICGCNLSRGGVTAKKAYKQSLPQNPPQGSQTDKIPELSEHTAAARLSAPFAEARLGRTFLWTVFLPVLVFSVLGLIDFMQPVVAAAFNLTVFLPCLIEGAALLCYAAALFKGKIRIISFTITAIIIVSALYVPIVSMIVSPLGFCDSLINLRKLFDIAAR